MSGRDRDDIPMLWDVDLGSNSGGGGGVEMHKYTGGSTSIDIPPNNSYDTYMSRTGSLRERRAGAATTSFPKYDANVFGQADDVFVTSNDEHSYKAGPLGMCNDPRCPFCPADYRAKISKKTYKRVSSTSKSRFRDILGGKVTNWEWKLFSLVKTYFPVVKPINKKVQKWNIFLVISCLVAIFIDPLFFFILAVDKRNQCIVFDLSFAAVIVAVRSVTDAIYLLHMLLQFRLAYVAPESRVVGSGDFVDEPKKIAKNYLQGYFILDIFAVLPFPQVMILMVIPKYFESSADYTKNLLRVTILLQYLPRMIRFLPLVGGQSGNRFIFESAWANFVINLLMFVLAGHVVGSCWYLFGFQSLNRCLKAACQSNHMLSRCKGLMKCRSGRNEQDIDEDFSALDRWKNDTSLMDCLNTTATFNYGIYEQAVLIATNKNVVVRYIYSLFWGFQQISTLAGDLVPSDYVMEVLFTMAIIGLGLLLFAMLIGNMQNFLQALGKRRVEMQLRRRDVEHWMSLRRLPESLRIQVREAERFNWDATHGVKGEVLLENLPENLQREIRRHLFSFLKEVRIFTLMDEPILDVIYERLKQKLYLKGSNIFDNGGPVEKMVFIVRGMVKSIGADGNTSFLSEGDVCGEELLAWCLMRSSVNKDVGKIRFPGERLFSNRTVKCYSNVETFALRAADLKDVTMLFARFLRNPRVQGAIRYESPYWRSWAADRLQVAWRYKKWRINRTKGFTRGSFYANSTTQQ